jgi:RHS repeat-associated protein
MDDEHGTTTYEYDVRNCLTNETKPNGVLLEYEYDLAGNRTQVKLTVGSTTRIVRYLYDAANRLKTVVAPGENETTFGYYKTGARASMTYPNGVVTGYEYNARTQLTEIATRKGTDALATCRYDLNPDGTRARLTDATGASVEYSYDAANRLTQEKRTTASGVLDYHLRSDYDEVGNLLQKLDLKSNATLATYTYDSADKISNADYLYDTNGSLTQKRRYEDDVLWSYGYDSQNRLGTAYDGTNNYLYEYDGDGHRVKQTANQITTGYVVDRVGDLPEVIAELNSAGNLAVFYVRGLELISEERNGTIRYYGHDGVGSTIILTDINGLPTDHYRYDAWGNVVATDGSTPCTFKYTGQQEDGTKLYYLRARYYGPHQQRFLARDVSLGAIILPLTLHRYLYANLDPVRRIDPTGQESLVSQLVTMGNLARLIRYASLAWDLVAWYRDPTPLNAAFLLFDLVSFLPIFKIFGKAAMLRRSGLAGDFFEWLTRLLEGATKENKWLRIYKRIVTPTGRTVTRRAYIPDLVWRVGGALKKVGECKFVQKLTLSCNNYQFVAMFEAVSKYCDERVIELFVHDFTYISEEIFEEAKKARVTIHVHRVPFHIAKALGWIGLKESSRWLLGEYDEEEEGEEEYEPAYGL